MTFSPEQIETGRRLFATQAEFIWAASKIDNLPPAQGIEIAFAGRSNVGKSSLVNALTNQNALARTSHTPGRTQELIFFTISSGLTLVDMPGYGYAAVAKHKAASWGELIRAYLRGRANLARVYVLIDGRHGVKDTDGETLDLLDRAAVSYQIVLTKMDQVEPEDRESRVAAAAAAIKRRPGAHPHVVATSSRERQGIEELRAAVGVLLSERRGG